MVATRNVSISEFGHVIEAERYSPVGYLFLGLAALASASSVSTGAKGALSSACRIFALVALLLGIGCFVAAAILCPSGFVEYDI